MVASAPQDSNTRKLSDSDSKSRSAPSLCPPESAGANQGGLDFMRFSDYSATLAVLAAAVGANLAMAQGRSALPNNIPQLNPNGLSGTFSTQGSVDLTSKYFQPQGANGRSCATCHTVQNAWSITPDTIRALFDQTGGTHPIFNP